MGRSKFPGKPSKSINRKRISVLQLEEDATAAATASTAEQEDGLATAAAATSVGGGAGKRNNCDDDDERGKGGGGGGGNSGAGGAGGVAGGGSSAANADSGGGGGGGGGTQNSRNVNGNSNTKPTSNGSASGNGSVRSAGHATTASAAASTATSTIGDNNKASTAACDGNDSSSTAAPTTTTATAASQQNADSTDNGKKNRQENANDADAVSDVEADSAAVDDMSAVARQARVVEEQVAEEDDEDDDNDNGDEDDDDDDDDEEDDNASSTSRKSLQSACSSASSTGSSTSFSGSGGGRSSNRKFKNLNLAKPEVMLPSSAKIRLQQELNCPSPASPAMNPFAIAATTANANGNDDTRSMAGVVVGSDKDGSSATDGSASHNCSDAGNSLKTDDEMLAPNINASKSIDSSTTADSSSVNNESKTAATAVAGLSPSSAAAAEAAASKKKTVTFKNILETSDDKSAVKKFYNPDNRIPLVSIMKKECMNRPLTYSRSGECIVRPSRLTEILKNNSNIDKLNSLKFRTATATATSPAATAALSESSTSVTSTSSLFSANLSRAFGAPAYESDHKHDTVTFRVSDAGTAVTNGFAVDDGKTTAGSDANVSADHGLLEKEEQEPQLADEEEDEEQQMIVDKHFVLPKRSTRSSRVIKPNKRLVEDGIICKKITSAKAKLPAVVGTAAATAGVASKKEQHNYFGLGNYTDGADAGVGAGGGSSVANEDAHTTVNLRINLPKETTSELKRTFSLASTFPTNFGALKSNNFILRQPRLQFDSLVDRSSSATPTALLNTATALTSTFPKALAQSFIEPKSPLSSTVATTFGLSAINNNNSLGTTSTCSVCGTPIHSVNLQQARKYGSSACGACRKFILKITRSSTNLSLKTLQLHCKGDGNCIISPHSKAHIKNFKKICKERCSSCWLKKCLQTLQFPPGDKLRISAALPTSTLLKSNESKREKDTADTGVEMCSGRDIDSDGLSPTGLFGTARFKSWKSPLETAGENLKLNLKSNPLAENNATFGSSTLLRPAILEKPLFLKNLVESQQEKQEKHSSTAGGMNALDKASERAGIDSGALKATKSKRKEKDKEKFKEKDKDKEKFKEKDKEKEKERDTLNIKVSTSNKTTTKATEAILSTTTATTIKTTVNDSDELTKASKAAPLSPSVATINSTSHAITTNSTVNSAHASTTTTTTTNITTSPSTTSTTTNASGDSVKRQRIDLKGPRVKHVCRSASIVLGQPLATFGEDEDEATTELADDSEPTSAPLNAAKEHNEPIKVKIAKIVIDENDNRAAGKEQPQPSQQQLPKQDSPPTAATTGVKKPTIVDNEAENEAVEPAPKAAKVVVTPAEVSSSSVAEPEKPLPLQPSKTATRNSNLSNINVQIQRSSSSYATTFGKKYIRQFNSDGTTQTAHTQLQQRRKEPIKAKTLISIDFWENYDPAEVCQTGFGLIVTETVAQRALCFLCGSTGLDPLLFCSCCCEPYHQYCVMDEYNLKHSSLDDTMASLLDNSMLPHNASSDQFSQLTNRLNWLCPRCTVCYTCNMSSGSKVKCQKCQKNYHSTCLGTSKRLLGADRPLICVNCLKCKSCSTTKVSKFVGNLPMCTVCFKLRKKGNYCPICQKCYDDNDFDLKMMECGDCKQWVHSKCEGLSDEQYNLLSTLPESIEFICKKCARQDDTSKQKAADWRQAVMEEFKTSLMSVLKLLSKSRQACALLKLSPRKKVRCTCGQNSGSNGNGKIQPKSLQFHGAERDTLGSDGESQCSDDVYEFKEKLSEERLREKCTCLMKSNVTLSANSYYTTIATSSLSLVDIKRKINNSEYVSLAEFNYDMNMVIQSANCDELVISYKEILSEQFPWFQNETKACTDALEEDMFESCSYALNNAMDTQPDFVDEEQERSVIDLPDDIEDVIYSLKSRTDTRVCLFCRKTGEGMSNEESRLLYCGHDCWVHTNCAMWSAEVFEEIDGSLQNVHSAVSRGRMIKCTVCGNRGATVGCNVKACGEHYHYPCARSIDCAFLIDKTMYCPEHSKSALKGNSLAPIETNFEVLRPVYVELDRKPKKCLEPTKVQFHIGSLEVRQLGTVLPRFSDSFEAIVPINFLCSRLYWSSKEPWKIVEYTVRTTIQNSFSTLTTLDMGRNFTVDHTNPNVSMVQLGLAQISRWHNSLTRGELMDLEPAELASMRSSTLTKLLPDYLTHSQNSSSATDENTEEEPQTNADLLPPEIKEAIFEDLPHELLDGISMLDIFPKFMIYEEMGNSDGKTEMFLNEQSKDGVVSATATASSTAPATNGSNGQVSDEDTANSSFSKQLELSNSWSSSNLTLGQVEDALLSCTRPNAQIKRAISVSANELQRNKADILKKTTQQRAWAKLDGATAAIKKRKLSKALPELRVAEGVLLSLSQQRAKTKETATVVAAARRQSVSNSDLDAASTLRTKTFTWSAAKRYIEPNGVAAATDEKDGTKIKLMQVDGVDDSITEYRIISGIGDAQFNGTVKCDRCHCTYRTCESFQRHLATCEPLSTSESESEVAPRSPDNSNSTSPLATADGVHDLNKLRQGNATLTNSANGMPFIQAFSQAIPIGNIQANINGIPIANMQTGVQGLQNIHGLQNLSGLQNIQLQSLQPQTLGGNFFISQATPTTSAADELQFLSNSLQSLTANLNGTYTLAPTTGFGTATVQATQQQPQLFTITTGPDGTQQIIQLPTTQPTSNQQLLQGMNATFQTLQTSNSDKKLVLPVAGKPIKTMATKAAQQAATAAKNKLKTSGAAATVKPIQSKMNAHSTVTQQNLSAPQPTSTPITVLNATNTNQLLNQNLLQQMQAAGLTTGHQQPQLLFQTNNGAGQQQPIVMQQLGATNAAMPQNIISFVTTDGSQTPQVQYLTIPTANDFKAQPFITATAAPNTNALMQGAFLQTDASGNLMLTTTQPPSGLQMLSATPLNISAQQQPQVIGTLIQPQTLQLGGNVIATTGGDPQQQQQVIIGGGATGLEMINASAPQVILATQPMYYGLETIVQNTVMSSQQFVSTAMPGVLSQNASFSATTTQVFQASKIEPLVDIPTGYVVLNNVDAGPSIVQQQHGAQQSNYLNATAVLQQQQQQGPNISQQASNGAEQQSIFRIHTSTADNGTTATPTMTTSFQYQPQQQQQLMEPTITLSQPQANVQIVTAKVPPVAQVKRSNAVKATPVAAVTKVQPQVVNKVLPTTVLPPPRVNNSKLHQQPQPQHNYQRNVTVVSVAEPKTTIHTSNNNNNNTFVKVSATTTLPTFTGGSTTTTQVLSTVSPAMSAPAAKPLPSSTAGGRKTNLIRPINKVEVKPKVMKAPAAVAVAKQLPAQQTKTAMLKPQPQPQPQLLQQMPSQPPLYQTELVPSAHVNTSSISNKLLEYNVNVQQPSFTEAQNAQTPQPQQPYNSIYTANGVQQQQQEQPQPQQQQQQQQLNNGHAMPAYDIHQQQQQQQQQQIDYETQIPYIPELDSVAQQQQQQLQQQPDILPPTHTGNINTNTNLSTVNANRCLQYSNSGFNQHVPTNIVNPIQQSMQQYTSSTTTAQQHNTSTTLISRPTNRVLPMQQRQENLSSSAALNTKTTATATKTVNSNHNKIYNNDSAKMCYEATEAKKKQQLLEMMHTTQQQQQQQQQQQILRVQQQQHEVTIFEKSLSSEDYDVGDSLKCDLAVIESETSLSATCQQVQQMVEHNLPRYTGSCLMVDDKQKMLDTTAEPYGHIVCNGNGRDINGANELGEGGGEYNNDVNVTIGNDGNAVEDDAGNDNDIDDDDDDGFSLKMPTEDGDHDMSDSDEPAVKEKISQILDNLTNEDCADSMTTATTVEAANVELAAVHYMDETALPSAESATETEAEAAKYANDMSENFEAAVTAEETAAVAAAATEYITQIAENMNAQMTPSLVEETNYELQKLEAKLSPQVALDTKPLDSAVADAGVPDVATNQETNNQEEITVRKPTPPQPHPQRDPKKITGPHLLYEIQSEDGFTYKSTSIADVWEKVFEAVQVARRAHGLAPLPEGPLADMSGVQMIGLKTNALKYLIEQLPGVEKCSKYTPKYHKRNTTNATATATAGMSAAGNSSSTVVATMSAGAGTEAVAALDYCSDQDELPENPYDSARCEPYSTRSEYDMFSWLASRHRKQPIQVFVQPSDTELIPRRGTGSNLPMAMKYRTLKETYKDYVGVFRSHIHGRGLYCTKDIEAGEMVIEYAGELIRSTLTDKRERNYDSRGIGCYMFKIDDNLVVDATMRGNAARFINHSCEPNCYSKVVDILGHKHIIIFALRRIVQGEELTYDYKFPFEDEKIPCSCGSKKCRKYLN